MARQNIKLQPGVNLDMTPALNEAGIQSTNLTRYRRGLIEKTGGWLKYFATPIGSIVRALHPWMGLSNDKHLAVAAESSVGVITEGELTTISARYQVKDIPINDWDATSGFFNIRFTDPTCPLPDYVGGTTIPEFYILTPLRIGGTFVPTGFYPVQITTGGTFNIVSEIPYATTATTNTATTPQFATTANSRDILVTAEDHHLTVGVNFPISTPVSVGGLVLTGDRQVTSVPTVDTFTIRWTEPAVFADVQLQNGGIPQIVYLINDAGVANTTAIPAEDWWLGNFGRLLIANPQSETSPLSGGLGGGAMYQWDPTAGKDILTQIPGSPAYNNGFFIAMPQTQIVTWGSTVEDSSGGIYQDPLLLRWCDPTNYTIWTAGGGFRAGSRRIPTGSRIVQCIQSSQQALVFTDVDLYTMTYVGGTLVWGFLKIADECGAISPKCVCAYAGSVYWLGIGQPWSISGSSTTPVPIPCTVRDFLYQNLNTTYQHRIRATVNGLFNEIRWYFPSLYDENGDLNATGENNAYIQLNPIEQTWEVGWLTCTAWCGGSALGNPIRAAYDQYLYQHEVGQNADTGVLYSEFTTGLFRVDTGEMYGMVDRVWPDFKWRKYGQLPSNDDVQIEMTIYGYAEANSVPEVHGPYFITSVTPYLEPNIRARFMAFRFRSVNLNSFYRIGLIGIRFRPDGMED